MYSTEIRLPTEKKKKYFFFSGTIFYYFFALLQFPPYKMVSHGSSFLLPRNTNGAILLIQERSQRDATENVYTERAYFFSCRLEADGEEKKVGESIATFSHTSFLAPTLKSILDITSPNFGFMHAYVNMIPILWLQADKRIKCTFYIFLEIRIFSRTSFVPIKGIKSIELFKGEMCTSH